MGTGAMLLRAAEVLERLDPIASAMAADLNAGNGTIHAEALTFALIERGLLSRDQAAARVGALSLHALAGGRDLLDLAAETWPDADWRKTITSRMLGHAPQEARAFQQSAAAQFGPRR